MTTRLSKLQRMILTTLAEKDRIDEKGYYAGQKVKPPYWHSTSDWYTGLAQGHIFPQLRERGVLNIVKKAGKYNEKTFAPSFSRSIRNMQTKGLLEKRDTVRKCSFKSLKLTEKALMLISDNPNLTITP